MKCLPRKTILPLSPDHCEQLLLTTCFTLPAARTRSAAAAEQNPELHIRTDREGRRERERKPRPGERRPEPGSEP